MPIGFLNLLKNFVKVKIKFCARKSTLLNSDECNYECELVDCKRSFRTKKERGRHHLLQHKCTSALCELCKRRSSTNNNLYRSNRTKYRVRRGTIKSKRYHAEVIIDCSKGITLRNSREPERNVNEVHTGSGNLTHTFIFVCKMVLGHVLDRNQSI